MKSIKKFIFVMAALAAVFAFVSCSNGSDDGGNSNNNNSSSNNNASDNSNNNGNDNNSNSNGNGNNNTVAKPSVVATYTADEDGETLIFYSDETWEMTYELKGEETVFYVGTTDWGNPAKNGSITITVKKMLDPSSGKLRDVSLADQEQEKIQINSGKLYLYGEYFTRQ